MKRIDSHGGDDREAEYDAPHTIESISRAIESHGHTVIPLEATPDFPRTLLAANVDVVFNIAEGISGRNREAQVPNLCELLGVPYTGSDSATLSICLDKGLSKRVLKDVDTAASQVLLTGKEKLRPFRYPVIVKPNQEGTSKGITPKSVVDDEAGVRERARELITKYGQPALVEEYIEGREFTVGLLGDANPRVRHRWSGVSHPERAPGLRLHLQAGLRRARPLRGPRQAHEGRAPGDGEGVPRRPFMTLPAAATSPGLICG